MGPWARDPLLRTGPLARAQAPGLGPRDLARTQDCGPGPTVGRRTQASHFYLDKMEQGEMVRIMGGFTDPGANQNWKLGDKILAVDGKNV